MKKLYLMFVILILFLVFIIFVKIYSDKSKFKNELLKNTGVHIICQKINYEDERIYILQKFNSFSYSISLKDNLEIISFDKEWYGDIDLADPYSVYGGGNTKFYFKDKVLVDKKCKYINQII